MPLLSTRSLFPSSHCLCVPRFICSLSEVHVVLLIHARKSYFDLLDDAPYLLYLLHASILDIVFPSVLSEHSSSLFFFGHQESINLWYLGHTPNFQCHFPVPFCVLRRRLGVCIWIYNGVNGLKGLELSSMRLCTSGMDSKSRRRGGG